MKAALILIFLLSISPTVSIEAGATEPQRNCVREECPVYVKFDWEKKQVAVYVDGQPIALDSNKFSVYEHPTSCAPSFTLIPGWDCQKSRLRLDRRPTGRLSSHAELMSKKSGGSLGVTSATYVWGQTAIVGVKESVKPHLGEFLHGKVHSFMRTQIFVSQQTAYQINELVRQYGPAQAWVTAN